MKLALILVCCGLAAPAWAQQPAPSGARRAGGRVIRLGEFRIEGQIQKPQAFYILQRSNLNFEGLELKNSFVPKIVKSVEQAPF
jgi:hypothetical protein